MAETDGKKSYPKVEPFKDVELSRQYPAHDVAEHEVLLSFTHDDDAHNFREWWETKGSVAFNRWHKKREFDEQ